MSFVASIGAPPTIGLVVLAIVLLFAVDAELAFDVMFEFIRFAFELAAMFAAGDPQADMSNAVPRVVVSANVSFIISLPKKIRTRVDQTFFQTSPSFLGKLAESTSVL